MFPTQVLSMVVKFCQVYYCIGRSLILNNQYLILTPITSRLPEFYYKDIIRILIVCECASHAFILI